MQYFEMSQPINVNEVRVKLSATLERHNLKLSPVAENVLCQGLAQFNVSPGPVVGCPFPLISTVRAAHSHAKRLKKAFGESGPSLGKCQQILANFYGFRTWSAFKNAIEKWIAANCVLKTF